MPEQHITVEIIEYVVEVAPEGAPGPPGPPGGLPAGGTTGQALIKQSNATGDAAWGGIDGGTY